MRRIQPNTYGSGRQLIQCLQSFAVMELLHNSENIYIHAPLLNDVPIVNSRAGEFSFALPDASLNQLSLTHLLSLLADRGSQIHICFRENINTLLLEKLNHPSITLSQRTSIYPPGWVTESYALSGVIYFRSDRIEFFEDEIKIFTEKDDVDKLLLNAQSTW